MEKEPDTTMVELTAYPDKAEIDMLIPLLEEADITTETEAISGGETTGFESTTSPRGNYRLLVAGVDLDAAREIFEQFEADRESMRARSAEIREPQSADEQQQSEDNQDREFEVDSSRIKRKM